MPRRWTTSAPARCCRRAGREARWCVVNASGRLGVDGGFRKRHVMISPDVDTTRTTRLTEPVLRELPRGAGRTTIVGGQPLPSIPWEDKPAGELGVVWRYSKNPV